ncbi:MAG: S-layer protein domain-containing protein [Methanothrix sp.]|jgi:S-layer protein (TIGR01567 family)|uniref:S-layer protein domain-containing protein n=1 Tax=Methanothrix sp. TaxID=90426 RepID=UPI00247CF165|nr:S-layer protein domain-containing protein [Methanothrix sp.]
MGSSRHIGLVISITLLTIGVSAGQIPSEIAEIRGHVATAEGVWNAEDFGWFVYDLNEGMGSESLYITPSGRTIEEGRLIYSCRAVAKRFEYENWGEYLWIGFLGKRYLAGYPEGPVTEEISSLEKGELREILIDSDDRYTISSEKPLILGDGYSVALSSVSDDGIKAFIELLRDGSKVDRAVVEEGSTYVWKHPESDIPLIMLHIRSGMHGRDEDRVDIDGLFQVSTSPAVVLTDSTRVGLLKVNDISGDRIELRNSDDIALSPDSLVQIAGGLALRVMDSPTLRYYPVGIYTEYGRYMIRGAVFHEGDLRVQKIIEDIPAYVNAVWDYRNYAGFYFDDKDMIGSETFVMNSSSRRVIPRFGPIVPVEMNGTRVGSMRGMLYYTYIQPKRFERESWGEYYVLSLFGELWFAGYGRNTSSEIGDKSMFDYERLGRVLIDTDAQDIATSGNIYFFRDGYSLLIRDVGKDRIFVSLLKNNRIVDNSTINSNSTYVYKKDVFDIKDLPVLAVHVGEIFRDGERQIAVIDGVFQISDQIYLPIEGGSKIGDMVIFTTPKGIYMVNDESKSLGKGSSVEIWPEYPGVTRGLYLAVADNDTLRYFPYTVAYVVPMPRIIQLGVPPDAAPPVAFNATVKAGEMRGMLAEVIDPLGRTVSLKEIPMGRGSGDTWRFEWTWNGTVPVMNDMVVPDADIAPTNAILYINDSHSANVGVLFDQAGRIERILGADGRIYYSRGQSMSFASGSRLAFFLWNNSTVVGQRNQTLVGDINALEPHIERVPAAPGRYTLQLRVQNIMGETVTRSTFNLSSPIYGTLPRLSPAQGNRSSVDSNDSMSSDLHGEEKSDAKKSRTASPGAGAAAFMVAIISSALMRMRGGLRRT